MTARVASAGRGAQKWEVLQNRVQMFGGAEYLAVDTGLKLVDLFQAKVLKPENRRIYTLEVLTRMAVWGRTPWKRVRDRCCRPERTCRPEVFDFTKRLLTSSVDGKQRVLSDSDLIER